MSSCTITGTLYAPDGSKLASSPVAFAVITDGAARASEHIPYKVQSEFTTDADGLLTAVIEAPSSGSWQYRMTIKANSASYDFYLAAGTADLTIDEVLTLAGQAGSEAGTPQASMLLGIYTDAQTATDGQLLTADGAGGVAWEDAPDTGIADATSDGNVYGRQDAAWVDLAGEFDALGAAATAQAAAVQRANHTGTQTASTISDFDTEVSNNADVAANTSHRGNTSNPHGVTAVQAGAEPALGNPSSNGYVLSSLTDGTRSWVTQSGGGGTAVYSIVVDTGGAGDYTTLSAALAAASAGDAIFVRNGTYAGGVTISLDNVRIVGESRDGVIIQSPLSSTPCITITGDNVTIENVTVDGRRASQSGSGSHTSYAGILVNGGRFSTVRRCLIKDTLGNGITGDGGTTDPDDGLVELCEIRNTATDGATPTTGAHLAGIQLINGTDRWRIANNFITGWSQAVGLWYGAKDCLVGNNIIYANYGYANDAHTATRSAIEDYGAGAYANHGNNIWIGNVIDGATSECIECAQGVIGSKFIGNVCRNANKFADATGFGVKIAGTAGEPTRDILFYGNTLYGDPTGAVRSGMTINALGGVTVSDNNFFDCVNTGGTGPIQFQGTTTQATISGNKISNCAGGIYTVSATAFIRIFGNSISTPATTNIMINIAAGSGYIITENKLDANGVNCTGIQIGAAAGDNHRISGNICTNFTSTPIDVRTDYNIVRDNRLQTTNPFGAITIAGGHYNIVTGNYCDAGGAGRTIYLQSSPTYNVIQDNTLVGASASVYETGVWVATSTNKITPNHKNNLTVPLYGLSLGAQTVGTSQATIAHGLPWTPREIRIQMTSAGTMWRSATSDATNIYLTADAAGRTAEVFVR